jgi:outer membrane protein OmpA-like peptidoglycan-associated protein
LVLSLFAVALLALCLLGIDAQRLRQQIKTSPPPAPISPLSDPSELQQHVSQLKQITNDLKVQLQHAQAAARAGKSREEQLQARIAQLDGIIAAMEDEKKQAAGQSLVVLQDGGRSGVFDINSAELTAEGKAIIVNTLVAQRGKLATKQLNTLLIEGFASPEPARTKLSRRLPEPRSLLQQGVAECSEPPQSNQKSDCSLDYSPDRNLDLSFRRARSVWTFLVESGMPRWCTAIMAHGRNRSDILHSVADSEEDIQLWDSRWVREPGSSLQYPVHRSELSKERRVVIRAINDPSSRCPPADLARALDALALLDTTQVPR